MLWIELGRLARKSRFQMGYVVYPLTVLMPFVLSAAVSVALTVLVAWHLLIICKRQVHQHLFPRFHSCHLSLAALMLSLRK